MKRVSRLVVSLLLVLGLLAVPVATMAESNSPSSLSGNDYPIILVHGLTGWGKNEMLGYKYWGGLRDIEANLNNNGHRTYVATVGPVSSNWDRAVELYYYIKGGTVDYGAAHAKEHNHARYGRTFPGIYSEWDSEKKIHLVGHSMGGQTIRTLVELLENGSLAEQEFFQEHPEEGLSPIFAGGQSWIHSVTSLATPHNGSTFADQESLIPLIKKMVIDIASVAGAKSEAIVYDFKLEQWGLKRNAGEAFHNYMNRVMNSSVWKSNDISAYDLTTYGAQELNSWVTTNPHVYYFSHIGNASYRGLLTGNYYPMITMNPMMMGSSKLMGSYTRKNKEPVIDKTWFPNDGLVNVVSGKYPMGQANQPYNGEVEKGVWNYLPTMEGWDHIDYIGILGANTPGYSNIYGYYHKIADQLHGLPKE